MADKKTDKLDEFFDRIGIGRWQIKVIVVNLIVWFLLSPHTIGTTFFNPPPKFRCIHEGSFNIIRNDTFRHFKEDSPLPGRSYDNVCSSSPKNETTSGGIQVETSAALMDNLTENHYRRTDIPSCPIALYDKTVFNSTVSIEWNLICEKSSLRSFFQNSYALGMIFGCLIGGDVGDRLGRTKAVVLGSILHLLSTGIVAFSSDLLFVIGGRFIVGLTNLMILINVFTLALEICPEKTRGPMGMLIGIPYSFGIVAISFLGYYIRDWRRLYLAISFPGVLLLPISFFLDESPRWLLQAGRIDDARAVLQKAITAHKVENVDKELEMVLLAQEHIKSKREAPKRILQRFRSWADVLRELTKASAMRRILIFSPIIWFFNNIIYYGVIFSANSFSGKIPFLYVGLSGAADALAVLLATPAAAYFGRRAVVAGTQVLAGLLILSVLAVPEEIKWLQWILVMAGLFMCACGSQALFVFTPELYPTTNRVRGLAFCNLVGYIGTLLAPLIPDVLATYGWWISGVTLGSMALVASCLSASLPETNHQPLCETVADVQLRDVRRSSSNIGEMEKVYTIENIKIGNDKKPNSKRQMDGIDNPALTME